MFVCLSVPQIYNNIKYWKYSLTYSQSDTSIKFYFSGGFILPVSLFFFLASVVVGGFFFFRFLLDWGWKTKNCFRFAFDDWKVKCKYTRWRMTRPEERGKERESERVISSSWYFFLFQRYAGQTKIGGWQAEKEFFLSHKQEFNRNLMECGEGKWRGSNSYFLVTEILTTWSYTHTEISIIITVV